MHFDIQSNYDEGKWRKAIVIWANWKDFSPGMTYFYRKVQSRFFVWCRYGMGTITVNRQSYQMKQGDFLFLPWNHSIAYKPDSENPFSLGCIHIIPDMPKEEKIYYNPFHYERPELPEYLARHDERLTGFEKVFAGHVTQDSRLLLLARYIVECFYSHCPEEILRSFPRQFLFELERESQLQMEKINNSSPLIYQILNQLDEESMMGKGDLNVVQRVAGISQATLYRLFRKHLNMTPGQYLMNRKLDFCAYLLRNTRLPIRAIAKKIGVDVSYFSVLFKKKFLLSPGKFRIATNIDDEKDKSFRYQTRMIQQNIHPDMTAW